MAVRPVLVYPHPGLKLPAPAAPGISGDILRVAHDLVDTMRAHERCVGLAAPQIGENHRVIAVDVSGHPKADAFHGLLIMVNPRVVAAQGHEVGREGCLSLPDITANVRRAVRVTLEATCLDGSRLSTVSSGFEARAIQHEIDHLDGVLILDRVASHREIFARKG